MADKQIAVEINCETGEVIERELTAEEIADREKARLQAEVERTAAEAAAQSKIAARKAIADKLGLTEADLNVLFSA